MSTYTALHRALGREPGPLTEQMIIEAVEQRVPESTALDFKSQLPPTSGVVNTDFPKDVAAMANSGGGTIVFGVTEDNKCATGRSHVELVEGHERTLRQAAMTAISPPLLGLQIDRLGGDPLSTVAITVPASLEAPHFIYKQDFFGAPIRNDADTFWMQEPQLAAMYRARFDRYRLQSEQLDLLYAQALRGRDVNRRAWFVAVANPTTPSIRASRMTRDEAQAIVANATTPALALARRSAGTHPLDSMDRHNPRPGFRAWVVPSVLSESTQWARASAQVGETGSVSLAAAVGAHPSGPGQFWRGSWVEPSALECALADFLGLLRATAGFFSLTDYDIQVGLEWAHSDEPLGFLIPEPAFGGMYHAPDPGSPMHFVPVRATVRVGSDEAEFRRQAYEVALDCVNQGGISEPLVISPAV